MDSAVTFRFRLPPVLLLRAPIGSWPRCPRGVIIDVAEDGAVLVRSTDGMETVARHQALTGAANFLRAIDAGHVVDDDPGRALCTLQ